MTDILGRCDLKFPIESRGERTSTLEVRRRPCLGDWAEMERRGFIESMEIRDDCQYRATVYLAQQLCGLTPQEAESIDARDMLAVQATIRPFLLIGSSETGANS